MKFSKLPLFLLPTLVVQETVQAGQEIDDASRLNGTIVSDVIQVRTENDIRLALVKAHVMKSHISIAGRRHSMGGQTFEKGNIVLNMLPFHAMSYEASSGLLTVQSGATWAQIQKFLDPLGRSVWVMQSDNIFSVGGTVSVNAHGWQPNQGPVASTVESFRLMLASGELKNCSRTENTPLFHAALGGYGLLGVILDVRLHTVPNTLYRQQSYFFPSQDYASMFKKHVANKASVGLAYGRLSIDREHFLTEAGLHVFEVATTQPDHLPSMEDESMVDLKNTVFRKSAKNDAGKRRRWKLEKKMAQYESGHLMTRNTLMNPDFRVVWNPAPDSRDILQEYFIPYERINEFMESLRVGVLKYDLNLLNITLRDIRKDQDALLAYAKTDVCALVLFLSQRPTEKGNETMQKFTGDLVDQALALGGSFYLPYRLHYSIDQFRKSYPQGEEFQKIKQQYDPDQLFTSQFYRHIFKSKEHHTMRLVAGELR